MDSKNFRFSILVTVQKFCRNVINFAVYFLEMNHYRQMNVVNDVEPLLIFFFVAVKNASWYSIISPCLLINILLNSKTSKNNFVQNHHFHSRIIMIEHVWKIHFWARKWLICYHWTEFHGIYASSFSTIVRYVNVDSLICHQ